MKCGNVSPSSKAWARSVLEDAENVRRLGTDGKWQHETPYKGELELLRHSNDLRFEAVLMRQAYNTENPRDWANELETFLGNGKFSVWTSAKVRECYNEVEQEDEDGQSIVQGILRKSTDFLRPIISKYQQHVWSHKKYTNSHHGKPGHGAKKEQGLNHGCHFSGVVGVGSGTSECKMSFSGEDWTKQNNKSSMR